MAAATNSDKRAALVADCAMLFRRLSYHGTSMSDIADVVRLNKGTVYYYFPAKADILYAIYVQAFASLEEYLDQVPTDLPADEALNGCVKALLRTISAAPDVMAVYFQERPWVESSLSKEQAATVRDKEEQITGRIRTAIRDGMRSNVFRRTNDQLLSAQVLSTVSSLYRWHSSENEASADLVADTIIGYLYDGILAPRH
jgi:AcrR family transcriptional regulator